MEWYERVKILKKDASMNSKTLSELSGVPLGTLNKLLSGQTDKPKLDTLEKIAAALGTTVKHLSDGDEDDGTALIAEKFARLDKKGKDAVIKAADAELARMEAESRRAASDLGLKRKIFIYDVPVSAGCGSFLDSSHSSAVSLVVNEVTDRADYAVRVSGDSMEPRYFDGDIVIVESCSEIPEGKVGIFLYNGESYIKKFGGDRLRSVNPKYSDIVFKENDDIRCLGLVLGTISKEK
ncbi:MAG: helix-turn-helix domain-containing protein [Clostridia bacterium]|nr:helix-turn-helix domain-containing protein [Clostridia bacterium]